MHPRLGNRWRTIVLGDQLAQGRVPLDAESTQDTRPHVAAVDALWKPPESHTELHAGPKTLVDGMLEPVLNELATGGGTSRKSVAEAECQ